MLCMEADEKAGKLYECPKCGKTYTSLSALNGHSGMCKGTSSATKAPPVSGDPAPVDAVEPVKPVKPKKVKEAQLDPDAPDEDDEDVEETDDMPIVIVGLVVLAAFIIGGLLVFWESIREIFRRPPPPMPVQEVSNSYGI